MAKIKKLTSEQEALLPVYRNTWLDIGLSAGETDKEKAESAIKMAYTCAGLVPPSLFIWTESPLHNTVAYAGVKKASVGDSVGGSVWDSVWASVWASVGDSVEDSVQDSVGGSVWDSVWASVWASVGDSVWDSVQDSVRDSVQDSIWASCFGLHDASWLAFYRYFNDVLGIDCSKLEGLWECAKEVGWFIPFQNGVIVSPKPKVLKVRPNNRGVKVLHAEGEPAVYYCDDFKIYAYDGVRLPEKYGAVHPNQWQARWLLEEKNAELRRVLIQGIGYGRLMQELGAQELDTWREYKLVKLAEKVDVEPILMVSMTCPSTGLMHAHRVPPDSKTARAAITWCNWGTDPEEFMVEA